MEGGGPRLYSAQHLRLRAVVDQRQAMPVHRLAEPARHAIVRSHGLVRTPHRAQTLCSSNKRRETV